MNRLIPALVLSLSLVGCASSQMQARSPAGTDTDVRAAEYKALQENVSSLHQYSVFGADDPRLFDMKTVDLYPTEFAHTYCGEGVTRQECAKRFDRTVYSKLSELYFAADPVAIGRTCSTEPLICDDLVSLETLFRRLHNTSVEESKQEKLNLIEDWRRGKLSDEELKSALHLDFKFENGKLVLSVPSA